MLKTPIKHNWAVSKDKTGYKLAKEVNKIIIRYKILYLGVSFDFFHGTHMKSEQDIPVHRSISESENVYSHSWSSYRHSRTHCYSISLQTWGNSREEKFAHCGSICYYHCWPGVQWSLLVPVGPVFSLSPPTYTLLSLLPNPFFVSLQKNLNI